MVGSFGSRRAEGPSGSFFSARFRPQYGDGTLPLTHVVPLDRAPDGYRAMKYKDDDVIKVVLQPDGG